MEGMQKVHMTGEQLDAAVEKLARRILRYCYECPFVYPSRPDESDGTWEGTAEKWKDMFRFVARRLLEDM